MQGIEKEASRHGAGRKFFDKAATVFLQRFRYVFEKHVAACWRKSSILHYMLGGHPALAKEFARWLVDYKIMEEDAAAAEDSDEECDEDAFKFKRKFINMGANHHRHIADKEVWVYTDEAMEYITAEADRSVIMESSFVQKYWSQIEQLAMCEREVDIFKKSTWGTNANDVPYDFKTLQNAIWDEIAIHPSHQQRCEQYVQLAALVAKTNVSEKRRTVLAIILSSIIRPFHAWAKEQLEERFGKAPRRVEGAIRGELLIVYMQLFSEKVRKARRRVTDEKFKEIMDILTNKGRKTSSIARKQKLDAFVRGLERRRKKNKAEQPTGVVDQSVLMTGGIVFKYLTLNRSCSNCNKAWGKRAYIKCTQRDCCMAAVHAEMDKRGIKLTKAQHMKLSIAEKRRLIRDDVAKNWNTGDKAKEGFNISSIRHFQPKSKLMKLLRDMCERELSNEMGINIE